MNSAELAFKESVLNKIKKYSIKTDFKEAISNAANRFVETTYSYGEKEIIDIGIEKFLCSKSPYMFIDLYGVMEIPKIGIVPCHENLYYFQREQLKIFNDYNLIVSNKCRQVGNSFLASMIVFWHSLFYSGIANTAIISKKQKDSNDFLRKVKLNIENIPEWMGIKIKINNTQTLELTNKSVINAYAKSESNVRGQTLSLVIADEQAFWGTEQLIKAIMASVTMALAQTQGKLFVISTPKGATGSYYELVKRLEDHGGKIPEEKAILFEVNWWQTRANKKLNLPSRGYDKEVEDFERRDYFNNKSVMAEAKKFFLPIEKNWKDTPFLRTQHELIGDVNFRIEILHSFLVTGQSVLTADILENISLRTKEPIMTNMLNDRPFNNLWIWKKPANEGKYIIAADIATGSGNDDTTIEIIDAKNFEQVAEYVGKCTTKDAANKIYDLAIYYNCGYVVVESNSIGEAVFVELYYNKNYQNLYKILKTRNGINRFTGFETTSKTRELVISNLIDWFYDDATLNALKINSTRLVGQLKTWVYSASGRVDHKPGDHDDAIMAFAIGLYLRDKTQTEDTNFFVAEDGSYHGNIPEGYSSSNSVEREEEISQMYGTDYNTYKMLLS